MARINFGPSPWASAGSIAGGLAEGFYMGQDLEQRKRQMDMEEKRQQMQTALQLLGLGAKAEDPQFVAAINQMLGQVAPGMPPVPVSTPEAGAQREMARITAQAKAIAPSMGIKEGTPEFQHLVSSMAGVKEAQEYTMVTGPDGKQYPVKKGTELSNVLNVAKTQAYLQKLKDGGHGGGGSGKLVLWRGPKGEPIYAPKGPPPVPGAVPATASSFTEPAQVPHSLGDRTKILTAQENIKKAIESNTKPKAEDVAILQAAGAINRIGPGGMPLPPSLMKPKKQRGVLQEEIEVLSAPAPPYEVPPPPEGFEVD